MNYPEDLQYAATHEWVRLQDDVATVGITDFAQDALGDVVFADLPAIGRKVAAGEAVCVLESVKTSSEIYSPYEGEIVAVNDELKSITELINDDCYGEGWIFAVKKTGVSSELFSAEQYQTQVEG